MNANDLVVMEQSRYYSQGTFQDSLRQVNHKTGAAFTSSFASYGPSFYIDVTWSSQGKNIAVNSPMPIIQGATGRKWGTAGPNLFAYGQGTLSRQATLKLSSIGEYYLEFDGVDDTYAGITNAAGCNQSELVLPSGLATSTSGGGNFSSANWLGNNTVIMVFELRTAVAGHLWGRSNNAGGTGRMDIVLSGGNPRLHGLQFFGVSSRQTTGATNIPLNTRTIGCLRTTSSATNGIRQELFYNGTLDASLAITDLISSSASRIDLGGPGTPGTCTLNFYHVVYYPTSVDNATLQIIHRYLGNRYGVTVP